MPPAKSSTARSARAATALATTAATASRTTVGFDSHGSGGAYRPIAGRRSRTSATRGASSARRSRTMNSSRPRRGREARGRAPVDRRDGVARPIRPRADHLAARAATVRASVAERQPGRVVPRNERDRLAARARPPHSSQSGAGGGASSRHRALTCASASSRPSVRVSAAYAEVSSSRWPSTGRNSCSMSSGRTWSRPVQQRPRPRRAFERQAAAHRRADLDALDRARRAHEVDGPAHDQLVDVHVLDGALQLRRARRVVTDRLERGERMAVALREDDRDLVVPRRVAERRSAGRTGRAAPRAAGTSPRARSGSRSRSRGTARAAARVTPSTVTCRSAIASSSADCVRGIARLISSTSTIVAKIGPGRNVNSRVFWSKIESPVTSVGCRSGVHWIRAKLAPSTLCAIARARIVFAVPGTSSSRTCPPDMSAARTSTISSCLPTTTRSTFASETLGDPVAWAPARRPPGLVSLQPSEKRMRVSSAGRWRASC